MIQKPAMVAKMTELAMQTRTHAHTEIRPSASATTSAGAEMAGRAGARVITSGRAKADTTTPSTIEQNGGASDLLLESLNPRGCAERTSELRL